MPATTTLSSPADDAQRDPVYLPVVLTLTALVSFFSLYLTARIGEGLVILAALLVASYFVRRRLPHERIVRWTARIIPMIAVTLIVGWPDEDVMMWYLKPQYTDLIGYLMATEIVIQSYLRRPKQAIVMNEALRDPVRLRESHGLVLLLSGGVMTMAANTYDRSNMQLLVPLFILLAVLSVRSIARLGQSPQPGRDHPPRAGGPRPRPPLAALRLLALTLALALGFAGVFGVVEFERAITNWMMDLVHRDRSRRSEIGLSGTARLRATFNPAASLNRVLLIEGDTTARHIRALSYDQYDDRLWQPVLRQRQYQPVELSALMTAREGTRLVVRRIGDTLDLLPVPLESVSIEPPEPVEIDGFGVIRTVDRGGNLRYEVVAGSPVEPNQNPLAIPPGPEELQRLLTVPADIDPAVVDLARDVAGNGTPLEKVLRLQAHLRANHEYSLEYQPDGEPISDFVLNQRAAHCQFFASALTVMARAVGVPAQMTTGFYAHERYDDDQLVVRDRDAHAWAEVFIEGAGWVTMDATPATGRPSGLFEKPSKWRQAWERASDIPRMVQEWLARVGREVVLWFVLALALLALGIWLVQRWLALRRQDKVRARRAYSVGPELAELAKRFEQVLQARGVPCEENRTWREHLAALVQQPAPAPVDPVAGTRFIDAYDEARFGGERGQSLSRAKALLFALEEKK